MELDRIETLPRAPEIVLAEDAAAETYMAFSTVGVRGVLEGAGVCRRTTLPSA